MSTRTRRREFFQHETHRLEALSDGVCAIALTLLIFDVVSTAKSVPDGKRLAEHLAGEWPTLVAFLVGFLTILVCWINHHWIFQFVRRSDGGLVWINGLQMLFVSAVPLPTAVLAANFFGEGRRAALIMYGVEFWLITASYYVLWRYVVGRGLTDRSVDAERFPGVAPMYLFAVIWTVLSALVAAFSTIPALIMWALMFVVYANPSGFARFAAGRMNHAGAHAGGADQPESGENSGADPGTDPDVERTQ